MRGLVGLLGLFNLALGLGFLIHPLAAAENFSLSPVGVQGMATLRADMAGSFITGGLFALIGALRAKPEPLYVPIILLAVALSGRFLSLGLDGTAATAYPPMVVEAVMLAILVTAARIFAAR